MSDAAWQSTRRVPASCNLASHTDVEDVGRLAAAAGVRTLVLTHFVPSDPPDAVSDGEWMESVRRHFKGEVILGRDLLEV